MTQYALSNKYIPLQIRVVPEPDDRFTVFHSYGTHCHVHDTFTGEELLTWLRSSFTDSKERAQAEAVRHKKHPTDKPIPIDIDFTFR